MLTAHPRRRRFDRAFVLAPLLLLLLLPLLLMQGCPATPGEPPPLDQVKPLLRLAVSVATERVLTANAGLAPQVVQVATVLEDAFDGGTFTSIAGVSAFVRAHVPWEKIGPDLRPLVEALVDTIAEELRVLATRYQISQTQHLLLVREVVGWVKAVAERHKDAPPVVRRVKATAA